MSNPYTVTALQAQEIRKLAQMVVAETGRPTGSRIDPEALIQALRAQLTNAGLDQPSPAASFDPDDFLYLWLPPEILRTPIEELELTARTYSLLKGGEINTLGDLLKCSATELEDIDYFGQKRLDEVEAKLAASNLAPGGLHLSRHDQGLPPPAGDEWVQINCRAHSTRTILRSRLPRVRVNQLRTRGIAVDADAVVDALSRHFGINTVGELLAHTQADILAFDWAALPPARGNKRSFGSRAALAVIQAVLAEYGHQLE